MVSEKEWLPEMVEKSFQPEEQKAEKNFQLVTSNSIT